MPQRPLKPVRRHRARAVALFLGTALWGAGAASKTLQLGSMNLAGCGSAGAFCGRLERPLDPTGAIAGRVSIYFEYYPQRKGGKPIGTLVATEGGPGYPATLSRDDYLALFGPLRARRSVVLMDNRGTGQSGALDCRELQTAPRWTIDAVAACGRSLGETAALYSTAYAADDLAAILEALKVQRIDLYGDSYGTYFEQVFAVRHPAMLRSVVLDGAYPLMGPNYAWYPSYAPAMRAKFNIACRRSPPCAALHGDSIAHILPALRRLRIAPFAAAAFDADGRERRFTADASALATVMFANSPAIATVSETDAAARAFADGDRAPLLRLMAETATGVDSRDPTGNAAKWSAGLAAAVMCQDPPQIFDMRLAPEARRRDRDRVLALRGRDFPGTYAPFTIDEYRGMPLDYSFLDQCVGWPVPPASHPASEVVPANAVYPDIPALIISGELDDITTAADGAAVARKFKRGRQIVIANSFHVNALPRARSSCGARLVRRFIEKLALADTRCADRVPPLALVPAFAMRSSAVAPATALAGNEADAARLRAAAAAVMTVGDALARAAQNVSGAGRGLRGGGFQIQRRGPVLRVHLDAMRWTEDVAVSGDVRAPARAGHVRANLVLQGRGGLDGRLRIDWPVGYPPGRASIRGVLGGAVLRAEMPTP